ncbi:Excreted virulence factor EspC, type VII ESX diderm [Prauserella aidingensis]|uniref:type VII secretion target n=1 Tax=Prauserella aidingensis TaxID=387890 RepID=UPI0020A42A45|nr:type VII secretion target [Prauserella aidingensis]MCP2253909.1 Excreted virulence factor EspC, type VII ESX diderm [Prauserella aidingensis]
MTGFDAVPDELRGTAGRIGETASTAAGLVWQGPSGDYGNDAVQQAWQRYIESTREHFQALKGKAEELGSQLGSAAARYLESDEGTRSSLDTLGNAVESAAVGMGAGGAAGSAVGGAVGGIAGGLGGALGGVAAGGISAVLDGGAGGEGQER